MPFKNRIRLPFYITRPQFPTESNTFRLANGSRKTLSTIIRKVFEGETDNLPREIHERLVIALKHDDVTIEGKYYLGGISLEGDYDIDWQKFLDYPLAKAAFKVEVTPFDYSNDNCQTCEELTQVACEDDDLGTVDEDDTITVHVLDNDSICCSPVTISLVTYDSNYLDSCIISGNDIIIHLKPVLPDANSVILVTYRAQCPNGSYDEANIIANINGSASAQCLAPTNLVVNTVSDDECSISWDLEPGAISYSWELYKYNIGVPILAQSGTTTTDNINLSGLTAASQYRFYIKSICDVGFESNFVYVDFITQPLSDNIFCGRYRLENMNFAGFESATYIDCNGNEQTIIIPPLQTREICAYQGIPGVPASIIISHSSLIVTYLTLC